MNFEKAVNLVLDEEGGFVDDPSDSGGATKFGISQKAYPDIDIKNMPASKAVEIYKRDYWDRVRCGELPRGLGYLVFDAAVNQGQSAAVKMLQQAAGVKVDGLIGPITLAAAKDVSLEEYVARRGAMYGMARTFHKHGLGWNRRLARAHRAAIKDAE